MQARSFRPGAAAAVIVINTIVGFTLGMTMSAILEPAMAWLLFAVLCGISVSEIAIVRLVVNTNAAALARLNDPGAVDVAAASLTTLISTFAIAPSIYGITCAVFMGSPWPAIPLSAMGLLLLALNTQYASMRIETARRASAAMSPERQLP